MASKGTQKPGGGGKLEALLGSLGPPLEKLRARITEAYPGGVPLRALRDFFGGDELDELLDLHGCLRVLQAGELVLGGASEGLAKKKKKKTRKGKRAKRAGVTAQPDPAGLERVRRSIGRSIEHSRGAEERDDDERVSVHVKLSNADFGTEADIKRVERFDGEVQQALALVKSGYAGDSGCGGGYYDLEYRGRSRKKLLAAIRPLFEQSPLPGESYIE